jgi:mannose-6-phosphate isomerase-like protein (cupin superfamily)
MRLCLATALLATVALPVLAQTRAPAILYAAPADVEAALAKAKAAPTMTPVPLVTGSGYRAMLEHRKAVTPASLHETEGEFVEVIGGSATVTVGGTLKDPTRRNETNLAGSSVEGGQKFNVVKGAYFYIPAGTAHAFGSFGPDGLTIISLHVPAELKR